RLDGEVATLRERAGRLEARWGAAAKPLAIVESSVRSLYLIATGEGDRSALQRQREITIVGDNSTAEQFLDAAQGAWRSASSEARMGRGRSPHRIRRARTVAALMPETP